MTQFMFGSLGVNRPLNDEFTKSLIHFDRNPGDSMVTWVAQDVAAGRTGSHSCVSSNGSGNIPYYANNTNPSGAPASPLGGGITYLSCGGNFGQNNAYVAVTSHPDFYLSNKDFTIDVWAHGRGQSYGDGRHIVSQMGPALPGVLSSFAFLVQSTGKLEATFFTASPAFTITSTSSYNMSTWNHVAVSRRGSTLYLFLNGNLEKTTSISGSINNAVSPNDLTLGRAGSVDNYYWNGYIEEFRLSVGIARWTSNFTPPAGPYI